MGWERRDRGGRYYTRSRKVQGRVVREYVGTGPVAEMIAEIDNTKLAQRVARREALRAEQKRMASVEAPVSDLCDIGDLVARAALMLAGYHRHKRGEWRKRRATKAG